MVLAIIITGFILLWFFRALYLKIAFPYEGRHAAGSVKEVPITYHPNDAWVPIPVKNRAWWNARMSRLRKASVVFMPLSDLLERMEVRRKHEYEQWLAWMGTNYHWEILPLNLWPDSWKVPAVAGSDIPSRALAIIDTFKPFTSTVRERLAA